MTLVDDVETCITMDLKSPGNELWIVGITHNELGASHYYKTLGVLGANVPKVNLKTAPIIMAKMSDAICHGLVRSCHDLSEGGLAVAASEMAFAGELGIHIDLKTVPVSDGVTTDEQILFSESASRFLIEVTLDHVEALTKALNGLTVSKIGNINSSGKVIFTNKEGQDVISATNDALKESWQAPLRW
jgi:phosphoribosylformylglycinamidine synthase